MHNYCVGWLTTQCRRLSLKGQLSSADDKTLSSHARKAPREAAVRFASRIICG